MPELPFITVLAENLRPLVEGRVIEDVVVRGASVLKTFDPPVTGLIETVIADVNGSGIPVVAIDLPSGLSADSCEPLGDSIEAGLTVTLAAPKLPLVLPPAETRAGDIVIADIGIPSDVLDSVEGPRVELRGRGPRVRRADPRCVLGT